MYSNVSEQQLKQKITALLTSQCLSLSVAEILTEKILDAERDGTYSHGLMRLPDYIASLNAGWVNPSAEPVISATESAIVSVDGDNGFTQAISEQVLPLVCERVLRHGIALLSIRNAHHIGALWTDNQKYAQQGWIVLNFVNSRPRLAIYGAQKPMTGTNAMAFSFPDGEGGVLGWDQASAKLSLGEVKQYALRGETLPPGCGLDKDGNPTTDALALLNGGTLLPFGEHKGSGIAMMVEVMAAALTGANFGYEDRSAEYPAAASSNAGQTLIVINPQANHQSQFPQRIADFIAHLHNDPTLRIPGERRLRQRLLTKQHGFTVSDDLARLLGL